MKPILVALAIALSLHGQVLAQTDDRAPIDTCLFRNLDLTGDGKDEEVSLHLKAKSILAPFIWKLTIRSEGKEILSYESDDSWLNSFFGESGYMDECNGYIQCKTKYYYEIVIDYLIVPYSMINVDYIADDEQIFPIASTFLENCCKTPKDRAHRTVKDLQNRLKSRQAVVISIPFSPVKSGNLMVYSPEVDRFVQIYED